MVHVLKSEGYYFLLLLLFMFKVLSQLNAINHKCYIHLNFTTVKSSLLISPNCFWRRKWQPTPVFLPGESQGRWAAVYVVAQSRTRLKRLSSSSSSSVYMSIPIFQFIPLLPLPPLMTLSLFSTSVTLRK